MHRLNGKVSATSALEMLAETMHILAQGKGGIQDGDLLLRIGPRTACEKTSATSAPRMWTIAQRMDSLPQAR